MNKSEAESKIADLIREADEKIREAEKLADEHGLQFSWDGPSYGMGGWYTPNHPDWESSNCYGEETGWMASSHSC